jgi:hypothetical protein
MFISQGWRMTRFFFKPSPLLPQLRLGLLFFLPLLVIINTIIWSAYSMLISLQREQWQRQAENGLDAAVITIEEMRNDLYGDLLLLANSPTLKKALDETISSHLSQLAAEWEVFASIKRRYDQIRWIDNRGVERLRVNLTAQGAHRIPENQLQDKSARYYYKEAISLSVGQIYASPVDLNIEHGEIERPYKPMLRLAVPVMDSEGRRRGLLLVNVLAEFILDNLARHAGLSLGYLLMIDSAGYYLRGFSPAQEWGFMFQLQDDKEFRFDKSYPSVWRQVVDKGVGRADSPQGQFIFRTVRYGTEGFSHRYFLMAAVLPSELKEFRAAQRQLWLSVSLAASLMLLALSLLLAHYLACCRHTEPTSRRSEEEREPTT